MPFPLSVEKLLNVEQLVQTFLTQIVLSVVLSGCEFLKHYFIENLYLALGSLFHIMGTPFLFWLFLSLEVK